jgi:hypothetical protein
MVKKRAQINERGNELQRPYRGTAVSAASAPGRR